MLDGRHVDKNDAISHHFGFVEKATKNEFKRIYYFTKPFKKWFSGVDCEIFVDRQKPDERFFAYGEQDLVWKMRQIYPCTIQVSLHSIDDDVFEFTFPTKEKEWVKNLFEKNNLNRFGLSSLILSKKDDGFSLFCG
jgi:hypothetical protein